MDKLSILHALSGIATKTWPKVGKIKGYSAGAFFEHSTVSLNSVSDFYSFLSKNQSNPKLLAIRGKFTGPNPARTHRKSKDGTFVDQPLHLFCIDIDKFTPLTADPVADPVASIDEYLERTFPCGSFDDVSYVWQMSSSAGHADNEGILKAHVWFWSSVAYTCAQMKEWAKEYKGSVDSALFQPVQAHYFALPVFEEGVIDPIKERCSFNPKPKDEVVLGLSAVAASAVSADTSEISDLDAAIAAQPLDLSEEQIGAYLAAYPASALEYNGWLKVGMALHHQFAGSPEGFTLWLEWSALDDARFDADITEAKWASFEVDSKPVTMASVIHAVKASGVVVSTRKTWLDRIAECDDKHVLEKLVMQKIAKDRTIGPVDLADIKTAVKEKFNALGVKMLSDPLNKMFRPKQHRALPDVTGEDRPQETIANVEAVCANNDVLVRYNVVKKDDEILIAKAKWSVDNAKSASLTWVRSACHKADVPTKHLKNIITLIADKNQFNPVVEWVTSCEWDGVSRVQAFYDTVVENKDECPRHLKELIMKRWAMSAVAAAFSPTGVTARGVLVFQGVQYVGKTRWIDALAPKDLDLIKTGRALNVHDKDSVKQIISCWISEMGELDATFKKSDIAALKAFITNDSDELRRPYAEGESRYARRTVFAASVNEKTFLQDDTGNTRFWVVSIAAIDHAHKLDMQQVWAEFYTMWCGGELHYMSGDEMRELNHNNEVFTSPEPISEMVASHLDWEKFSLDNCVWMQPSDVLRWIGHKNPTKWDCTVAGKTIAKLNGGHRRKSNGQRLTAVPLELKGIGGGDFV